MPRLDIEGVIRQNSSAEASSGISSNSQQANGRESRRGYVTVPRWFETERFFAHVRKLHQGLLSAGAEATKSSCLRTFLGQCETLRWASARAPSMYFPLDCICNSGLGTFC
jgi:hypothetical protein